MQIHEQIIGARFVKFRVPMWDATLSVWGTAVVRRLRLAWTTSATLMTTILATAAVETGRKIIVLHFSRT